MIFDRDAQDTARKKGVAGRWMEDKKWQFLHMQKLLKCRSTSAFRHGSIIRGC